MSEGTREARLAEIGKRIRQRRRELDLTQEELAEAAGVSKSFVSEVEGGQTAANGLIYLRLADNLEVTVQWLLTGTSPEGASRRNPERLEIPPLLSQIAEQSVNKQASRGAEADADREVPLSGGGQGDLMSQDGGRATRRCARGRS